MSVTNYRTVSSSNPATLISQVKTLMAAGWQPLSGHVSGSYNSGTKLSQVMVKGSGTSYTDYDLICSSSESTLNTLVTAAIAAGWDVLPGGVGSASIRSLLCQPMIKGTGVVAGAGLQPSNNLSDVPNKTTALTNLGAAKKSDIDGIVSFADLRTRQPAYEGERIWLKQYNGTGGSRPYGGGWFIGHLATATDDGGFIAAGTGFYWMRDKEFKNLNVLDFGAIPGGTFDCGPAAKRMYEFLLGKANPLVNEISQDIRVTFPAGKYYVSPQNWTTYGTQLASNASDLGQNPSGYKAAGAIIIEGVSSEFGKIIGTTIVSDKSDNPVFHLNHRYLYLRGITWDGQQTVAGDVNTRLIPGSTQGVFNEGCSNKQPFLDNDCPAGSFSRINCFRVQNTGNYGVRLRDTLDSKFDQIYSNNTAGPVLISSWTDPLNQWFGKWDHSTAIELTNFNFQSNWSPAFWFPRVGQGLIANGWIEHGNIPYDINNGQWLIDALSVEDCQCVISGTLTSVNGPMWNGRIAGMRQFSGPTGNAPDFTTAPGSAGWMSYPKNPDGSDITAWQGGYETGHSRLEAAFSLFNHPVVNQWQRGILRGYTDSATRWVRIGVLTSQSNGGLWKVRIKSKNGLSTAPSSKRPINDGQAGETTIWVSRNGGSSPTVTMGHTGYPGVRAGQFYPQFNTQVTLWVQIASYTEYDITLEHTGLTRMEAGQPSTFAPDGAWVNSPGQTVISQQLSMHNNTAGFGVYDSAIAVDSQSLTVANLDMTGAAAAVRVKVNGVDYGLPVYGIKSVITTQPTAQTVTAGGTLTLSVVATDAASYQWRKGGTVISGATSATYTKASVVSGDAGSYDVVVTGYGPAGSSVTSNAVTVTVN